MNQRRNILIVGGGIAGTALAGLLQDSYNVTLIEEGKEWRTIGYAVGIWKSGLDILKKLNLSELFWKNAYQSTAGALLDAKGKRLMEMSFRRIGEGVITQAVTREDLHRVLIAKISGVKVFFGTTVKSLTQADKSVEIIFSDDSKGRYDLVVGADGVYSKTREKVFGKKPLRPYGWFAWGGYADRAYEHLAGWYALCGPGEFLLSFPITAAANTIGLICHRKKFKDSQAISRHQDLHTVFKRLDFQLGGILDSLPAPDTLFFSELYFVKMKEWYKGRVVLAGDSKHARSPVSGLGTTLALEDAYVLADELTHNDSIDIALRKYAKRRQARVPSALRSIDFLELTVMRPGMLRSILMDMLLAVIPSTIFAHLIRRILEADI
jgi:2-polyprenyl-6-methoxyphenol hydroxylase-like FAD-dependent oxidoreductase